LETILKTCHLTKQYKDHRAVNDINLTVNQGEIYGLLGQNGAGKTTTLRMILGLIQPTEGHVELFGHKVSRSHSVFTRIGSIIEFPGFYMNLNAIDNLEIHRRLVGYPDKNAIEKVLSLVGLFEFRKRIIKKFSLGMKQRLGIARALLHQPELLILDEPTNGLDPVGIKEIRQLLLDLTQRNKMTILISSHILTEIEQLATNIGIIHEGKLLDQQDIKSIQENNHNYLEINVRQEERALMVLERHLGITECKLIEPGIIRIYERVAESEEINHMLIQQGIGVKELSVKRAKLEDYYLNKIGGNLHA
jgi:bacitracin transport system ATP-binding protein